MKNKAIILGCFGAPRSLEEVYSFIKAMLLDNDLIPRKLNRKIHNVLFSCIAKLYSKKLKKDYADIGGFSPLYQDSERLSEILSSLLCVDVIPFYRYLEMTHDDFISKIRSLKQVELIAIPMFPFFTHAVSGSIMRWIKGHIETPLSINVSWIKSFGSNPYFISSVVKSLENELKQNNLNSRNCSIIFSTHGIPQYMVDNGDPYYNECMDSFNLIKNHFPSYNMILSFQSKFGIKKWIQPSTKNVCSNPKDFEIKAHSHIIIVPFGFLSDHIETISEIEEYTHILNKKGFSARRAKALNFEDYWINSLVNLIQSENTVPSGQIIKN